MNKNGGNVASYFCTPDGRVINAVLGPVGAADLLRETVWAIDMAATDFSQPDIRDKLAKAHRIAANQRPNAQARQVHQFLAARPLAGLDEIYGDVFDNLLGEAERRNRPNPRLRELEEENERLKEEEQRLRGKLVPRPDGRGPQKELKKREEVQERLREVERLRQQVEEQRKMLARKEREAGERLRVANSYLQKKNKADQEEGQERLKEIVDEYPGTQAAQKATELLARQQASPTRE